MKLLFLAFGYVAARNAGFVVPHTTACLKYLYRSLHSLGKHLDFGQRPHLTVALCAIPHICCLLRLVMKWRFSDRVRQQMSAFMNGFNEFIPHDLLKIFDENEVEVIRLFGHLTVRSLLTLSSTVRIVAITL